MHTDFFIKKRYTECKKNLSSLLLSHRVPEHCDGNVNGQRTLNKIQILLKKLDFKVNALIRKHLQIRNHKYVSNKYEPTATITVFLLYVGLYNFIHSKFMY